MLKMPKASAFGGRGHIPLPLPPPMVSKLAMHGFAADYLLYNVTCLSNGLHTGLTLYTYMCISARSLSTYLPVCIIFPGEGEEANAQPLLVPHNVLLLFHVHL